MQSQNLGHPIQQPQGAGHPHQPPPLQQQQQQQQQPGPPQPAGASPNGVQEPQMSLAGVLHYLQTEWRRWERDRNEWEIERAEMRARIALLEGERRSADNLKTDLSRRVKLLEFALRQERSKASEKQPAPGSKSSAIPPGKLSLMQAEGAEGKDGSASSEGGSDDGALPNGVRTSASPPPNIKEAVTRASSVAPSATNGTGPVPNWKTGVAAAGRDPKSRQRSRDYLKQCLQEVSYLTSPGALNPLPSRPIALPPPAPAAHHTSLSPPPTAPAERSTYAQAVTASSVASATPPPAAISEAPQPTILVRPRKALSENPPPSPVQGIPTSLQESLEQQQEDEEAKARDAASQREAEAKEAAARADQKRLEHVKEKAPEMTEEEIRLDTEARAIPRTDDDDDALMGASATTIDEVSQRAVPDDAALEAAIDITDEQVQADAAGNDNETSFAEDDGSDLSSDATFTPESAAAAKSVDGDGEEATTGFDVSGESSAEQSARSTVSIDGEENHLTAMFRPPDKTQWRNALSKAGSSLPTQNAVPVAADRSAEDELANLTLNDNADAVAQEDGNTEGGSASESTTSDAGSWRTRRTLKSHVDSVRDVACHPTDLCIASASEDCTVKLWRLDLEELTSDKSTQVEQEPQLTFRGHSGAVTCVVFHPAREVVFSGSLDATVRAWKVPDAAEHSLYSPHDASLSLGVLVGHTDGIWGLAIVGAEGQRRLVSASADGTVKVWDAEKSSTPLLLSWDYDGLGTNGSADASKSEAKPVPTSVCAVGSDPSLVAVAYANSVVKLFDASSGKEVRQLETDASYDGSTDTQINKITSHPSRSIIFSAHEDKLIRLTDVSTGKSVATLPAHTDGVCALAVSALLPNSLASVGHDGSLQIWDLESEVSVQELSLHRQNRDSGALGVAIHAKERLLVTTGADAAIRVLTWSGGPAAGSTE